MRRPEPGSGYRVLGSVEERYLLALGAPASPGAVDLAADALAGRVATIAGREGAGWIDFQVELSDALEGAHAACADAVTGKHAVSMTFLVLVGEGDFRLAHLGAGRPLVLRKGIMRPLTKEHTEAFQLYEAGGIRAGELPGHPGAQVLTRGLGFPDMDAMTATAASFRRGELHPGMRLLLPMGQVSAVLGEEGLLELLQTEGPPEDALAALAEGWEDASLSGGVLVHVGEDRSVTAAGTGLLGHAPAATAPEEPPPGEPPDDPESPAEEPDPLAPRAAPPVLIDPEADEAAPDPEAAITAAAEDSDEGADVAEDATEGDGDQEATPDGEAPAPARETTPFEDLPTFGAPNMPLEVAQALHEHYLATLPEKKPRPAFEPSEAPGDPAEPAPETSTAEDPPPPDAAEEPPPDEPTPSPAVPDPAAAAITDVSASAPPVAPDASAAAAPTAPPRRPEAAPREPRPARSPGKPPAGFRKGPTRARVRWVPIDQESALDDPVVLASLLVAASVSVLGLLSWSLSLLAGGG